MTPRAASRIFVGKYSEKAVIEVAESLRHEIGTNASLGVLFLTQEWRPHLEDTLELIRLHGHVPQLVGCSGWGIIGSRREIEHEPGFSLILFSLPAESFSIVQISETQIEESTGGEYWRTVTGLSGQGGDFLDRARESPFRWDGKLAGRMEHRLPGSSDHGWVGQLHRFRDLPPQGWRSDQCAGPGDRHETRASCPALGQPRMPPNRRSFTHHQS